MHPVSVLTFSRASIPAQRTPFAIPHRSEAGLWASNKTVNNQYASLNSTFVVGMVKGGTAGFAIKAGDATQQGGVATVYAGARPPGYQPMNKKGAIILGIGGDNSNLGIGVFFEGVITQGYSVRAR